MRWLLSRVVPCAKEHTVNEFLKALLWTLELLIDTDSGVPRNSMKKASLHLHVKENKIKL